MIAIDTSAAAVLTQAQGSVRSRRPRLSDSPVMEACTAGESRVGGDDQVSERFWGDGGRLTKVND
ncbi:hypothetical protein ACF1BU_31005 [Streptomyces sp. NPDC014724]|uniref:hypothetical protein n=1 Tax=unclassified Streptomyces TaxID=2593676 RepID=UPI0036FF6B66